MPRQRITEESRQYELARERFDELKALSIQCRELFFMNWVLLAESEGKDARHALDMFIEKLRVNRRKAAEAQGRFAIAFRSLMKAVRLNLRFAEINGALPSTLALFDPVKHDLVAFAFLHQTEPRALEAVRAKVAEMNRHFLSWIDEVARISSSSVVDLSTYAPNPSLLDIHALIKPFIFQDIVLSGEGGIYFLEQSLEVIRQGIERRTIEKQRYVISA